MAVRVLVVDDNSRKLASIIDLMKAAGVPRREIETAKSVQEARRHLAVTRYDLMVLDIALPAMPEDEPDRKGGVKLLQELIERGTFQLPLSIVGLTAYEDLAWEFDGLFHSRLWSLEHYDPSESGWMERLKAKTEYILARSQQTQKVSYETDFCVLAALQTPEMAAVRSLPWEWTGPHSLDEVGYFYKGKFSSNNGEKSVVAAAAPRMGMVATAVLTMKMILKFRPKILVMVGICAGIRDACSIGDVLVADPAWDWQMGKHRPNGFQIAPDAIDIPTAITERCNLLALDHQLWFDIHQAFVGPKPNNPPRLKVGPVTSGSAVLANAPLLSEIRKQHRNVLGVEMELYGLYAAARDCSPPNPITFGMKSVCDFADAKKNDAYQAYAAHVSVQAFVAFVNKYAGLTDADLTRP